METNYVIYTDASADIDPEFMKNEDIRFVPMRYMVGEEERLCESLEEEAFLKKILQCSETGKSDTDQSDHTTYVCGDF